MNAMRRRGRAAVLTGMVCAAGVAATGCVGSGPGSGSADGPLALYTWAASEGDQQQWADFISGARQEDPNLEIVVEGPSFQDYWTKVKTRLSGANPPCLLTTQAARAQELGELLMPLDDLVENSGLGDGDVDESMLSGMTIDGTLRAIPYDAEPIVLFYNVDAFEAAGLELPGVEYTRDRFLADARALTAAGTLGVSLAPGIFMPNAWALADGVPAVTEDGELDLTDPDFVEQIQSLFDLVAVDGVAKAPEAAYGAEMAQQAFTNGEAAMYIDGPWNYATLEDASEFTVGMTIIPSSDGKARGMTAGSGFGIATTCDRPEEAFAALTALTSLPVQEKQAAARGIVPSRIDALPAWAEGKREGSAEVIEALLGSATPQRTTPTWNQVETLMMQYGVLGYRGEMTAEEVMETIQNSVGG
ncbi:ABC transporter substrate-binding protein [Microbacterium resistens]|uniref:ABC transporter substrate-binding protein n=1 Tax=Microbacterium resistens TaxID=156977 RepID=UPI00366E2FD5